MEIRVEKISMYGQVNMWYVYELNKAPVINITMT